MNNKDNINKLQNINEYIYLDNRRVNEYVENTSSKAGIVEKSVNSNIDTKQSSLEIEGSGEGKCGGWLNNVICKLKGVYKRDKMNQLRNEVHLKPTDITNFNIIKDSFRLVKTTDTLYIGDSIRLNNCLIEYKDMEDIYYVLENWNMLEKQGLGSLPTNEKIQLKEELNNLYTENMSKTQIKHFSKFIKSMLDNLTIINIKYKDDKFFVGVIDKKFLKVSKEELKYTYGKKFYADICFRIVNIPNREDNIIDHTEPNNMISVMFDSLVDIYSEFQLVKYPNIGIIPIAIFI